MKKLIIILGCVAYLYGQTGKITGNILDASSEKPLVGVSVILIDQGIGADTDQNGRYTIINVPLGSYELKTSYIGYASVIAK